MCHGKVLQPNRIGIITDCNIISLIGFPPLTNQQKEGRAEGKRSNEIRRGRNEERRINIVDIYFHNQQRVPPSGKCYDTQKTIL